MRYPDALPTCAAHDSDSQMPNAEANRAPAMVDALATSEVPKATADETSPSAVSVTHAQSIDAPGLSNADTESAVSSC